LNINREVRRSRLLLLLWPDRTEESARALLNTALWRVKRAIRDEGFTALSILGRGEIVRLETDDTVVVDAAVLEETIHRTSRAHQGPSAPLSPEIRTCLVRILDVEGFEFLEGSASDWVLVERERQFNFQIRGLSLLMQDRALAGQFEEALEFGRKILRMDPMRESVQRQVIWLYVLSGQCCAAIRQYQTFVSLLVEEAGIAPMPETQALYEYIVASTAAATPGRSIGGMREERSPTEAETDIEARRLERLFAELASQRQSIYAVLAE
jgi:DNA-binding SARP family transcriptional activator